jgi:response regulator RpfG family c-di-GMP phosphodiesterase
VPALGLESGLPPRAKAVCDLLVQSRLLKPADADAALKETRGRDRVEDILLNMGVISESDLLKGLASHFKVQFISTEKLARVDVQRALVNALPRRVAEAFGLCPVVLDPKTSVLTVVTADPDQVEPLREAQMAAGAREVKPVLARPGAVRALIAKIYGGDAHAFTTLEREAQHFAASSLDHNSIALDDDPRGRMGGGGGSYGGGRMLSEGDMAPVAPPRAAPAPPPPPPQREASPQAPPPAPAAKRGSGRPPSPLAMSAPSIRPTYPHDAPVAPAPRKAAASSADRGVSGASFVELLNVLVSLLESSRADLRGHSALVARLVRRMAEKLSLDPGTTAMLVAGAFIHDLGKMGQYHLTPLNCSEYEGHKAAAQKAYGIPGSLLEPVRLPPDTLQAATRMYERWDGKGFPDGLGGKDIPLGARILAICDTYADMTVNPRNPFRKALSPQDACMALAKYKETIFDPNLVDLFRNTILGEELTAKLLANRSEALLIDVDPEETTVLELRLVEQGFIVKTARNAEQALAVLAAGDTDLVVSDVDLGQGDGLALLAEVRKQPWGKDLPWVIYTRRQERAAAQKAFSLGVLDYVNKPASAEVLVAKLKALLDQRASASPRNARGVSGNLREMGLPDMVQVLFHGRKSGKLIIRGEGKEGEIHFIEGTVMNAFWAGVKGEDAFYAMLKLTDGEFEIDPTFKATEQVINQSAEALLLEGMRRLDEGI